MDAFEAKAAELLERFGESDPATWAREWAELHDRWGLPCWGFPSWASWAVAAGTR